jgi:hypothetical protein
MIPLQIAKEHGEINEENLKKIIDNLVCLFGPLTNWPAWRNSVLPASCYPIPYRQLIRFFFIDVVTLQLRILGSRQKLQFKWEEDSPTRSVACPYLFAHSDENGVPLDEPKAWWEPWPDSVLDLTDESLVGTYGYVVSV